MSSSNREGAGGGGSGGAVWLSGERILVEGQLFARGGRGGYDEGGGGENKNDGGWGGAGRIKLEAAVCDITSVTQPRPKPVRPPLVPFVGTDLLIKGAAPATGQPDERLVTLNTDGAPRHGTARGVHVIRCVWRYRHHSPVNYCRFRFKLPKSATRR
jgi:hypothetical protein